jgi:hypothetical protein
MPKLSQTLYLEHWLKNPENPWKFVIVIGDR